MNHQIMPATLNLDEPDPEADLDFVPHRPRSADFEVALTKYLPKGWPIFEEGFLYLDNFRYEWFY